MGRRSNSLTSKYTLDDLIGIKEAARLCNRSQMTLRNWDKEGLLKPIGVTSFGGRVYSKKQVSQFIKNRGSDAGLKRDL